MDDCTDGETLSIADAKDALVHVMEMLGRLDSALDAALTVSKLLCTAYARDAMVALPDLSSALLRMLCPTAMYDFDCRVASAQALAMIANTPVGAGTLLGLKSYKHVRVWVEDLHTIAPTKPDGEWLHYFVALFAHCV